MGAMTNTSTVRLSVTKKPLPAGGALVAEVGDQAGLLVVAQRRPLEGVIAEARQHEERVLRDRQEPGRLGRDGRAFSVCVWRTQRASWRAAWIALWITKPAGFTVLSVSEGCRAPPRCRG
jgi:hypothetical protein